MRTITAQLQTVLGISLIEMICLGILVMKCTYLEQTDTPDQKTSNEVYHEWTSDTKVLEAFERWKLAEMEDGIIVSMNN